MVHHLERDDRLQAARDHLEAAIVLLDELQLHQAAANADLALSQIARKRTSPPAQPDWPSLQ